MTWLEIVFLYLLIGLSLEVIGFRAWKQRGQWGWEMAAMLAWPIIIALIVVIETAAAVKGESMTKRGDHRTH